MPFEALSPLQRTLLLGAGTVAALRKAVSATKGAATASLVAGRLDGRPIGPHLLCIADLNHPPRTRSQPGL